MPRLRDHYSSLALLAIVLLTWSLPTSTWAEKKPKISSVPSIRWEEGKSGCTFLRGEDGKYRWGLWTDDLGIVLAVDSQELQLARKRLQPMLGLQLTLRYRGNQSMALSSGKITLEFVDHFHVIQAPLNPEDLSASLESGADELEDELQRQIRKHGHADEKEQAQLEAYQKDVTEMQEFLANHSLRPIQMDSVNPETSGWVFFSTKNKWIGEWKKQEHFLLRIPTPNRTFEFPFTLPPVQGELMLRQRGN